MNNSIVKFNIRLEADSGHHCSTQADIRSAFNEGCNSFMLELYGHGGIAPDMALTYYQIFEAARGVSPHLEVYTLSHSNLVVAGDWLLWLLGKPRDIRPNAWLYFPSAMTFREEIKDDGLRGVIQLDQLRNKFHLWSYKKCLEVLDEYIPVQSWSDRKISVEEIREFGLLDEIMLESQLDEFVNGSF